MLDGRKVAKTVVPLKMVVLYGARLAVNTGYMNQNVRWCDLCS
jgi:hypothetical protein